MDLFRKYRSPLGYFMDDEEKRKDSYGVDHSGFSTRDELEYQTARSERENELIQNYNNQGITKDYPQQGTNFWGNPENNYGFGNSNISANIESRKQNQTSLTPQQNQMQNSFASGNNNQNQMVTNNNSQANQTPSNGLSGNNNGLNSNFNNNANNNPYAKLKQWLGQSEQNINSALYPKPLGDDANSYQLAQNNKTNTMTDANNNQNKPAVTFNDIYWGNGDRQNTHQIEGGYNNNRANDRGGPTNFAVTQGTLNEYNNWNSSLRTGFNFPKDVRNLTPEQARQILDERFYQAYNIKALQNQMIASNVFDAEINQGTQAGRWLADSVNEHFETTYPQNMVISPKLAEKINNLSKEDAITINDIYTKKRMQSYWDLVDKDHSQINNIKSWYNRARNHYSNPQEFDRLYQSILDEYLNRKYPQYYNGK